MQPTLALSASHPGILYLNGRFAGEISPEMPLIRPIAARGAVYLDYRPLSGAYRSMTRKLVFSGGTPLPDSVEEAENLNIILWPGGVTEIEFAPESAHTAPRHFRLAGHDFVLDGETSSLECDGHRICILPEGSEIPELHLLPSGAVLTGGCTGGKYLLSMDTAFQKQTGFLHAVQLNMEGDGRIHAISSPSDLVGHAVLENWRLTPEGLMLLSSEPAWLNGAPRWPQTPEETVKAAVEAALAGLDSEAELYLSPALRSRIPLAGLREKCDLCVEMKYVPPSARPCVGLLKLEGTHMGRVSPLYFRTSPSGGPQGPYQIESLEYT